MNMHTLIAAAAAASLVSSVPATAAATDWDEWSPAATIDLTATYLDINPVWQGGILQVRLWRDTGIPSDWSVTLGYGVSAIELNAASAEPRIVDRPNQETRIIDILLPVEGRLHATMVNPPDLHVLILHVAYRLQITSQQLLPGRGPIDSFDSGVDADDREMALGFGLLELRDASNRGDLGTCTGFRIVKSIWLTAGHCFTRESNQRDREVASFIIHPSDYAVGSVDSVSPFAATPVATGQTSGIPRADLKLDLNKELDYTLLEAPMDPGGPGFPLDVADELVKDHDQLKLFMHWSGPPIATTPTAPNAGKARSADGLCRVVHMGESSDPAIPFSCPGQIQHGCSSDAGASGSPLLLRQGLRLIGLHYGLGAQGSYNCALRISKIREHIKANLCIRRNELARRIVTCP